MRYGLHAVPVRLVGNCRPQQPAFALFRSYERDLGWYARPQEAESGELANNPFLQPAKRCLCGCLWLSEACDHQRAAASGVPQLCSQLLPCLRDTNRCQRPPLPLKFFTLQTASSVSYHSVYPVSER